MPEEVKIPIPEGKYISQYSSDKKEITIQYKEKKKIALLFVCLNHPYWPYLRNVVADAKERFLPHHDVDYLIWSDMPEDVTYGGTVFPTEAVTWPYPTLMRYHLFLGQEEKLKDYDYLFYCDADMRIVDFIGDEILGEGLTVAEHPMYALRKEYVPPYEPNSKSTAYIPRVSIIVNDEGKQRLKPVYAAGGFQGGETKSFITAMKAMKKTIDKDFDNNYVAIWNDESHWNKYLLGYKGQMVVLSPSYIYPDSLIKEYYEPLWGRSYPPKIVTLTKPFSLTKEGGAHLQQMLGLSPAMATTPVSNRFSCNFCGDILEVPGHRIDRVTSCLGKGQAHQVDMTKI